ncbi:MAG: F0F1 ATP synthase subunit epsilon [Acidobacteriota bacterium]|nr:F0F1 ATP synthase subunit epsilon [Acidobacteriota bacterium]MDP3717692.1 F0F1 ATP synthase subunit epsilon [Acidobacteriota bacterium]
MALPSKLTLHIVSPDHSMSYEVDEVSLPGVEGDFGVLPGHTPFFTALRTGAMWYRQGAERHSLLVSIGFVEVLPDKVSILAQVAERAEDLDQARAEAGMKRAEEQLGAVPHDIDWERSRLALLQTLQQLQAESRRRV